MEEELMEGIQYIEVFDNVTVYYHTQYTRR